MKRPLVVAIVLIAACIFGVGALVMQRQASFPIDFQVLWRAAKAPVEAVYMPSDMPFVYPPTGLLLLKPLALFPFFPAYFAWIITSALVFGLTAARFVGPRLAALSFVSPAAMKGIILGQSAMLLGGLTFLALLVPPLAGGALLGIVAVIKPQLVLMAPLALLIRRDWAMFGGMAGAVVVLCLASLLLGPSLWADWLAAIPGFRQVVVRDEVLSMVVTPAGQAEHWGLPPLPFLLLGGLLGIAANIIAARNLEGELLVALIVASSLVASPYGHTHDTIAIIPACLVLIVRGAWWAMIPAALIFVGTPELSALSMLFGLAAAALGYGKVFKAPPGQSAARP